MSKEKMTKEELRELILQMAKEGKVVFSTFDSLMFADLEEIIKQPTEGLLYDLNRDKATVLSWIDDPKWINDFAVASVIEELKKQNEQLQKEINQLHEEKAEVSL